MSISELKNLISNFGKIKKNDEIKNLEQFVDKNVQDLKIEEVKDLQFGQILFLSKDCLMRNEDDDEARETVLNFVKTFSKEELDKMFQRISKNFEEDISYIKERCKYFRDFKKENKDSLPDSYDQVELIGIYITGLYIYKMMKYIMPEYDYKRISEVVSKMGKLIAENLFITLEARALLNELKYFLNFDIGNWEDMPEELPCEKE